MKGAKADEFITNSTDCVAATEVTVSNLVYSIQGYLDNENMDNYFNITKSVSGVTPMLKTCYDVSTGAFDKIIQHFSEFQDFFVFMQQFMFNAIGKMADFQNIYQQIEKDYADQKYAHIANLLGVGLRKMFDFEAIRSEEEIRRLIQADEEHDAFEQFFDFTMAFLDGTRVLSTPNMTECSTAWVDSDHLFNKAV